MIELFDLEAVNKAASALNHQKLLWLNQHYIKTSSTEHIARHLSWHLAQRDIDPTKGPQLERVIETLRERAKTLVEMADSCLIFYRDFQDYDAKAASKHLTEQAVPVLKKLSEKLSSLPTWEPEVIHDCVKAVAQELELGMGKVAQPLRVACTGGSVSPPIDQTLALLDRERSLDGITRALRHISAKQA